MAAEGHNSEEQKTDRKGEGYYLFCLARPFPHLPEGENGLDERHPLFTRTFDGIVAVLSTVDLEEFCGEGAQERMQSLEWIGPRACRHEKVIEEVMLRSPVLPARFGTLFSSMELLEDLVESNRETVLGFLRDVEDKEEWSVKGMIDRRTAAEERVAKSMAEHADRLGSMSSGKRYFEEQRIRTNAEKAFDTWLQAVCRELADDLRELAAEVSRRKLLSRDATGADKDMILNWAILVPRSALDGFRARIDRANRDYGDSGLAFEISGPWPAYSFSPPLEMEAET